MPYVAAPPGGYVDYSNSRRAILKNKYVDVACTVHTVTVFKN